MAVYYIRETQQNVITSTPRGHNKKISLPEGIFFLMCNHMEKTIKDLGPSIWYNIDTRCKVRPTHNTFKHSLMNTSIN